MTKGQKEENQILAVNDQAGLKYNYLLYFARLLFQRLKINVGIKKLPSKTHKCLVKLLHLKSYFPSIFNTAFCMYLKQQKHASCCRNMKR